MLLLALTRPLPLSDSERVLKNPVSRKGAKTQSIAKHLICLYFALFLAALREICHFVKHPPERGRGLEGWGEVSETHGKEGLGFTR